MLGREADAGEHLLAVARRGAGAATGERLRHRRADGRPVDPCGIERGRCGLDGDERLRQTVAHGLEHRDRASELHALERVNPCELEHRAGRTDELVADGERCAIATTPTGADRSGPDASIPPTTGCRPRVGSMPLTSVTSRALACTASSSPSARATTSMRPVPPSARPLTTRRSSTSVAGGRHWPSAGSTIPSAVVPSASSTTALIADDVALASPCRPKRIDTASRGSCTSASCQPRSASARSSAGPVCFAVASRRLRSNSSRSSASISGRSRDRAAAGR